MPWLTALNARLSRWAMYGAVASLLGIVALVVFGVVKRYVFNDSQAYVEQVVLILVIIVAMFAASAGVRDEGHIGMESLVGLLPPPQRFAAGVVVGALTIIFGVLLVVGCSMMLVSVYPNRIPTLGISEGVRYVPPIISGVLVVLFSLEHLLAMYSGTKVEPSWY
jgi:TRAP-type C4-dicarboxylate transport system permease small subunit